MSNTFPSPLKLEDAIYNSRIDAGDYFMHPIYNGQKIRFTDIAGDQNADVLFFNLHDADDMYDPQNTMREQKNIYIKYGSILRSVHNNPLVQITADTCGVHDTLGGACANDSNAVRYGHEKRYMHSCRDTWILACSENPEYGVRREHLRLNVNILCNVPITPEGGLIFADGTPSKAGDYVEFTALTDTLILVSNCSQINNPCCGFDPTPLDIAIWN